MWAMATQYATSKGQMYVTTFDATPRLHVKQPGSLRESYSLTFGESLVRYGKDLKTEFLASAYRRAGMSFGRLLEEHFVVLNDRMRPTYNRRYGDVTSTATALGSRPAAPAAPAAMSTPATAEPGVGEKPTKKKGGMKRKSSHSRHEEKRKKGRKEHSDKKKNKKT